MAADETEPTDFEIWVDRTISDDHDLIEVVFRYGPALKLDTTPRLVAMAVSKRTCDRLLQAVSQTA